MSRFHSPHFYAGHYIDRLAERRRDEAWLRNAWQTGAAVFVPVRQGRVLIAAREQNPQAVLLGRADIEAHAPPEQWIFLGKFRGLACFAVELPGDFSPQVPDGGFEDLRMLGGELHRDEAGLLGYARAMILWRDKHRYCGRCGTPTHGVHGGHALQCGDAKCALMQFPRLDPAVIVLVTDGDRALLGRQAAWAAGRYSTIAGYVEVGESVEEAVAREVREETGVEVDAVQYHASQPWPFPSSLMLGFFAGASDATIHRGDMELEDAKWYSRAELRAGSVILPPPQAISFDLIETWYDRGAERPLRTEPAVKIASFTQRSS